MEAKPRGNIDVILLIALADYEVVRAALASEAACFEFEVRWNIKMLPALLADRNLRFSGFFLFSCHKSPPYVVIPVSVVTVESNMISYGVALSLELLVNVLLGNTAVPENENELKSPSFPATG